MWQTWLQEKTLDQTRQILKQACSDLLIQKYTGLWRAAQGKQLLNEVIRRLYDQLRFDIKTVMPNLPIDRCFLPLVVSECLPMAVYLFILY